MFNDSRQQQKIAARIERVLIVDTQSQSARLLGDLLRADLACEVFNASSVDNAYAIANSHDPDLIFVEHPSAGIDGYALTRKIRRSELPCRMAPVIMVTAEATAAAILTARDAGLHEFLRKPYTAGDLQRRLEAVTLKPRDWVEAVQYIGPDRRRFNSADYAGPRKRRIDVRQNEAQGKLQQALQIVRAAAAGIGGDPKQARRALDAQVIALKSLLSVYPDMASSVISLEVWELEFPTDTAAAHEELQRRAEALMPFMPASAEQSRAA